MSVFTNKQAAEAVAELQMQRDALTPEEQAEVNRSIETIETISSNVAPGHIVVVTTSGNLPTNENGRVVGGYWKLDISVIKWP